MRILQTPWRKRAGAVAAALAAGVLLAACHSSHESRGPAPDPTPTPPAPVVDSFFTYVSARVASLLDTDEPIAIDAVAATAPDNTEPEPVQ